MHRIRWMIVGAIATLAWLRYRQQGRMGLNVPAMVGDARRWLADLIDEQGQTVGQALEGRTHAWSERLRTNGKARRIPVEGGEG